MLILFWSAMAAVVAIAVVRKTFIVVSERHNVVKERLGKFAGVLEPGWHFMVPIADRQAYRHEMREQAIDVPPQMCVTKDNIQVEVDGVVYLKVVDAKDASYNIADYGSAAISLAQTMMRSEIGKLSLDQTFSEREAMNEAIVREIDKASDPWGIKVLRYEVKNITPSNRVIDTMEKQMEAERQKRAAILISTGQKEAKINISEGERTEAVNLSEGQKQRRINEAEGQAEEIRRLAEASAQAIELVAAAIKEPGGEEAVKAKLTEQFIGELGKVLEGADVRVLPANMAQMQSLFEGIKQVTQSAAPTPAPAPQPTFPVRR